MDNPRKIYDIEPDGYLDAIMVRFRDMVSSGFNLYHIEVEGGNEDFYDRKGSKPLKGVVSFLRSKDFELMHVVNRFGDVYVITKQKPEVGNLQIVCEDGESLEVKLVVSEVPVE